MTTLSTLVSQPKSNFFDVQVLSDLHLEKRKFPFRLEPVAANLALCGDIGNPFEGSYRQLIKQAASLYTHVFVIAGNHEYYASKRYHHTMDEINAQIARVVKPYAHVFFLNNTRVDVDGVRILGTTLWSDVPRRYHHTIAKQIRDYQQCIHAHRNHATSAYFRQHSAIHITPSQTTDWHQRSVAWLSRELRDTRCMLPTLILSHHAPLTHDTIQEDYRDSVTRYAYCSDLRDVLSLSATLKAWAFGHTHHPYNRVVDGVHLLNNPEGYLKETHLASKLQHSVIRIERTVE